MPESQDDNDDDISITSTVVSTQVSEYEVEAILAQHRFPDGIKYLVKWANYSEARCTWEPEASFTTNDTIAEWDQKQTEICSGEREAFDVARWNRMRSKSEEDRKDRKRRREAKRKKLGLPTAQITEMEMRRSPGQSHGPSGKVTAKARSAHMSGPQQQSHQQAAPMKKPVVPKHPLVPFGSGQKLPATPRPKSSPETTKWFSHLSTRRKHEKAKSREPAPDINQLELFTPSEGPPRTPLLPKQPGPHTDPPCDGGMSRRVSQAGTDIPHHSANPCTILGHSQSMNPGPAGEGYDLPDQGHGSSRDQPPMKSSIHRVNPPNDKEPIQSPQQSPTNKYFSHIGMGTSREKPPRSAPRGPRQSAMPESSQRSHNQPIQDDESRRDNDTPDIPFREPGPAAKWLAGRFCNPGEVLIHMFYGPDRKPIGAARLCGLSLMSIQKILQYKSGPRIEVWFQHTCNFDTYQALCDRVLRKRPLLVNRTFCCGWIEGYNDTEPVLFNMARELERGNLMAIFNPDKWSQNVLLAYSPNSSDLRSLNNDSRAPSDASLLLVVRNSFGTRELHHDILEINSQILASRRSEVSVRAHLEEPDKGNDSFCEGTPMSIPSVEESVLHKDSPSFTVKHEPSQEPLQEPTGPVSPGPTDLVPLSNTDPAPLSNNPRSQNGFENPSELMEISQQGSGPALGEQQAMSALATADLKGIFQSKFGISYEELVKVNSVDKVVVAEAFYLMIPQDSVPPHEFLPLQAFLKARNPVIYTCYQSDDWEKFARTVAVGVVLFHESFVDFHTLPFFKSIISKPFNFWSFSLEKPLDYADHPLHFQRIFPHGGVLMITEDFMTQEPESTIIILAWFNDWARKKFPGNWKIMFRPGVLDWVLKQPEPADELKQGIWLTMYRLILQLCTAPAYDTPSGEALTGSTDDYFESNVISPPSLPNYGSRTEDDNPDIPRGLSQEQRNTDHLIEFFAGWGLVNRHRYRRFVVLTRMKPHPRWEAWQHIEIKWGAKDFMKGFKVDYKLYWAKLTVPSTAKPSKTTGEPKVQPATFTPRTPRAPAPGVPWSIDMGGSRLGRLPGSASSAYPEPYN
ncbi:hypothetical protein BO70DRAFT_213446 [Aspergillus heteromorphus CBS 117.55]|uniref:Chromo domain-containing protein n=1 Tax=Aspergillus heteromorphus CBS 117.55 TaxID=1448321 RepID=A0A317WKB2_9EURO|nr:uncharacterized protein BO70DRAFT_213446 [Aspergillus heteromorphus CBS 117.55]PWY86904.1 hypothetical protein BO70DRAFT_213446 [Aspergillus heteromorphus CBS 117.55]